MAKKKKKYAVYKNINKESDGYQSVWSSFCPEGEKVGNIHGSNECVLITDDFEIATNLINTHHNDNFNL